MNKQTFKEKISLLINDCIIEWRDKQSSIYRDFDTFLNEYVESRLDELWEMVVGEI